MKQKCVFFKNFLYMLYLGKCKRRVIGLNFATANQLINSQKFTLAIAKSNSNEIQPTDLIILGNFDDICKRAGGGCFMFHGRNYLFNLLPKT